MALYDAFGREIDPAALDDEFVDEGGPYTSPLRDSVASGLTPQRLGGLLRLADEGDVESYLTLAEEMEERDLHYRSVIHQRRSVISSLDFDVEAAGDDAEQQRIAEAVRELLRDPSTADLVFEMLDAVGKGYSIVEILWDTATQDLWWPRGYRWRDPRYFRVDPYTLRGLRLDDGSADGRELPAAKFVMHYPKLKSGVPLRNGLARLASIAFVFKSYTIRDCARFLEAYGIPPRLGRYPAGTPADQRRRLLRAARALGTDAAAIMPEGMSIELLESPRGTSSESFLAVASWWDRQISKGVLGQTSSSEGGAGDYKASQQHQGVRMDLARHDARQVAASVARQVVRPFVDLNFGTQERYPSVSLPVPIPEDLTKFAAAVTPFVDRGLRVSERAIREKLGLPEPEDGASTLSARAQGGPQAPMGDAPGTQDAAD